MASSFFDGLGAQSDRALRSVSADESFKPAPAQPRMSKGYSISGRLAPELRDE